MSTGKTTNLKLNQWSPGDRFLREEFNADNSKIDEAVAAAVSANTALSSALATTNSNLDATNTALSATNTAVAAAKSAATAAAAANCFKKLMDTTTTANATQVTLNTSTLNLSGYSKILVVGAVKGSSSTTSSSVVLNFTGGTVYTRSNSNSTDASAASCLGCCPIYNGTEGSVSTFSAEISAPFAAGGTLPAWVSVSCMGTGPDSLCPKITQTDGILKMPAGQSFPSITFTGASLSNDAVIKTGSRFCIYGVKL